MKKSVIPKEVVFAYVSRENRKFIDNMVKESNQAISHVVDRILDGARLRKAIHIDKAVPEYVKRARAWEKRNQAG